MAVRVVPLRSFFPGTKPSAVTHLSRTINLLVVLNISLFFLTGAVGSGGYWFPIVSLCVLALAAFLTLLPLGLQNWLPFYLFVLMLCLASGWFLGASIHYWFKQGGA